MANPALITDAGVATVGAGPVLTKVTPGQGMTFTVRGTNQAAQTYLTDLWRESADVGLVQVTSPNIVPVSNGIEIKTPANLTDGLMPKGVYQTLTPQDALVVQDNGTAAAVDLVALQTYYTDTGGGGMKLKNPGDIYGAAEFIFGWPVAVTSSATAGNQGTALITATVDSSSANYWYALLGIEVDVPVGVIGLVGTDTSQLLCGKPGSTDQYKSRSYFADRSLETGLPCIPCFNAANKGSTSIAAIDHAASVATNATMILAQMPISWNP